MEDFNINELRMTIAKENLGWEAAENEFSQLSQEELIKKCGVAEGEGEDSFDAMEAKALKNHESFLKSVAGKKITKDKAYGYSNKRDWRASGYVTPVKDQGNCGSCVAFGNVAALEAMYKIKTERIVNLSESELFFCHGAKDTVYSAGCNRGWYTGRGAYFLREKGVVEESEFPYGDYDQSCKSGLESQRRYFATDIRELTTVSQMKEWIDNYGPVVGQFTVYSDFFSYRSGIYRKSSSASRSGGHCICVVGYDDYNSCWICKNSWGANWGENGFFRIAYGQCGIDAAMWGFSGVVEHGYFYSKVTMVDIDRYNAYVTVPEISNYIRKLALGSNGRINFGLVATAIKAHNNRNSVCVQVEKGQITYIY